MSSATALDPPPLGPRAGVRAARPSWCSRRPSPWRWSCDPGAIVGLVLLAAILVPLQRLVPFRRQRTLRTGLLTDLTHLLVNGFLVTVVLVVAAAIPLTPRRRLDLEGMLPTPTSVALLVVVALVGSYWGHRLRHEVAVAVAVPRRAQHRGDGLGGGWAPAPVRLSSRRTRAGTCAHRAAR